jgi:hypothetical protein
MQYFTDTIQDRNGNVIGAATITITDYPSGTASSVYATNAIGTVTNPITANSDGEYSFYAIPGSYTLTVSKSGIAQESKVVTLEPVNSTISVLDYGAVGDGVTNDTAAFTAFITAVSGKAGHVPDPSVAYLVDGGFTLPDNTTLYGDNKYSTKITLNAATTMFTLGNGAALRDLYLDGNSKAAIGVNITSTNGQQQIDRCKITDFALTCLNFASVDSGSGFTSYGCLMYRVDGATPGNYAIVIEDAAQLSAVPRKFANLETGGYCAFSFGGSNNTYVTGSFLGDVTYSANSRGVNIVGSRLRGTTATTINGANNGIVGCDVNPVITIAAAASAITLGPCSWNSTPLDNSGLYYNLLFHTLVSFTPTFDTGTTPTTLGNAVLSGTYTRNGIWVEGTASVTIGNTTTMGTGALRVGLPIVRASTDLELMPARIYDSSANAYYVMLGQTVGATQYVQLLYNQAGYVTHAAPATWATGDVIIVSFRYHI